MANDLIDGDALLEKINPQLPEVEAFVCLRPDLLVEWEKAQAELVEVQGERANGRLAGQKDAKTGATKHAKKVQDLEQQMRDATTMFRFRALSGPEFQKLVLKHPPREGHQFDFLAGYNAESLNEDLVRLCLVNMTFTDEGWARLLSKCAPSEWAHLREKALEVNRDLISPPKSELASEILGQSNAGSK